MKFIETRTYGYLDYATGILMIVIAGLGRTVNLAQIIVPVVIGLSMILFNLVTSYEISITNIIPMKVRLKIDFFCGALLAASPWIFNFAGEIFWPHVLVGAFAAFASLLSKTKPQVRLTIWR
jgi:hypothetical protein